MVFIQPSAICIGRKSVVPTWRLVPLTLALCLGPPLDTLYFFGLYRMGIGGLLSTFQVIRGLLLLAMFLALPKNRFAILAQRNIALPLLLLAIYSFMMAVFRPYPLQDIIQGFYLISVYVTFVSALEFSRRGWLGQAWLQTIPWVFLGLVVCSQVLGMLFGVTRSGTYELAATGIAGSPSSIGRFAVSVLPWFLALTSYRILNIVGAFIVFGVATASMRRSAFVMVSLSLIVMIIYYLAHAQKISRKLAMVVVSSGVCLVFFVFLYNTSMGQAFSARLEGLNIQEGGTASGRTVFMIVALNHLRSRDVADSIFGEGAGVIGDVIEAGCGVRIGSHNAWTDITTSFGGVGLVLLLWFNINVIRLFLRSTGKRRTAAFGVAVVVLLGGVFMNSIYVPTYAPLYGILGVLASAGPVSYRKGTRYA